MEENTELINDIDTLREMLEFVKNTRGRAEALPGKHDDLVMGLAIAYQIATQQSNVVQLPEIEEIKLPDALKTENMAMNEYW